MNIKYVFLIFTICTAVEMVASVLLYVFVEFTLNVFYFGCWMLATAILSPFLIRAGIVLSRYTKGKESDATNSTE